MAADNINKIVSEEALAGLDEAIAKLIQAKANVLELSEAAGKITFNPRAADTLNEFVETMQQAAQPIQQTATATNNLAQATTNLSQSVASNGENLLENSERYARLKIELERVNSEIKLYNKQIVDGDIGLDESAEALARLVKAQQQLKVEISETTSQLKTEIKEVNAATGSMDEMSQTLFQLKERYRALSAEERNAAEVGGLLNKQIAQLDIEVKKLDATIGNNQRNVGNYANGFKNVAAELAATKQQLQQMTLSGQQNGADFKVLSDRAKVLSESMRDVDDTVKRSIFSMESLGKRIAQTAAGMLVHTFVFAAAIEGISLLIEYFTKLSDAEQLAADAMKNFDDATKSFNETVKKTSGETAASIRKETDGLENLLTVYARSAQGSDLRLAAYNKLQGAYSQILPALTEEEIKTKKITVAHESAINKLKEYIDLKERSAGGLNLINASIDQIKKDKEVLATLGETLTPQGKKAVELLKVNPSASSIDIRRANDVSARTSSTDIDQAREYVKALKDINAQESFIAITKKYQIDREQELLQYTIKEKEIHAGRIREDIDEDIRKQSLIKDTTAANTEAHNAAIANLKALKKELDDYNGKEEKAKKIKDTSAKDAKKAMEDDLKAIELTRKKKDEAADLEYARSAKSFDDEYKLISDKLNNEKKAWADESAVLEKFSGKIGETREQELVRYNEYSLKYDNILTKTAETVRKVNDEISAEYKKGEDYNRDYINKLEGFQKSMDELTASAQDKMIRHSIAMGQSGMNLFGGGMDESTINAGFDISAKQEKVRLDNIALAAATERANQANFTVDLGTDIPVEQRSERQSKKLEEDRKRADKANADLAKITIQTATDTQAATDAINKEEEDNRNRDNEKKKAALKEIAQLTIQLAETTMQAITTIADNQFAKQSQQLQRMAQKEQTAYNQKKEAIAATTNYQIVKDNQLAKLAAQHAASENEMQQKQNELAIKKAKFEKQAAETAIIMNTAIAITKILAEDAYNPVITAVLIGLTTATGAAQLAAVASAPIPQFWTGGTTETPIFSAGERGMELMTTPDGKSYFSEPTATIYSAPVGTEITDHATTMKMINYAANGVNSPAPNININPYANDAMMAQIAQMIGNKFQEVGEDLVYAMNRNRTVIPKSESMKETLREINNSQKFGNRK